MIYKIKKMIEQEVDLTFPLYYEYAGFVKIISPDSYIRVRVVGGEFCIDKIKDIPICVDAAIMNGRPCTADEFKEAYWKALNHVTHEAFMQAHEGESKEQMREVLYADNMELCESINDEQ